MKLVEEFRDGATAHRYAAAIRNLVTRPWRLMEVCGGQTHAIVRFGIDQILPENVTLIHGPGCPVCVTGLQEIDRALAIAALPQVTFCSFGDMLRVPGSSSDLLRVKANGGDVRVVYSPLDALDLAAREPRREVVFFAVGFETTAPATAMAVFEARRRGIGNFSVLMAHVLVPPAIRAILSAEDCRVDGFLAAGHVCTIMGMDAYLGLVSEFRVPIVATGFEPLDLLQGIYMCLRQLEEGRAEVENQYERSVTTAGNRAAQAALRDAFEIVPRAWRGLGGIADSGLGLRADLSPFDAKQRFVVPELTASEPEECRSGLVLQGKIKPPECPAFATACTPERPLGATMVSSEGTCAAYYRYRRQQGRAA